MILDWNKPEKVMTTKEWKSISADNAPQGVFVPNMSEEDRLKWKAKFFGGEDPRVEVRKSFQFTKKSGEYEKIGERKFEKYNSYTCQMCLMIRLDDTYQPNVLISANGKMAMSYEDVRNLDLAIKEAVENLKSKQ